MASDLASASNAWVASYLDALLSFGLSSEYTAAPKSSSHTRVKDVDADKQLYSRYYVRSLLNLDEKDLKNAWSKAASATKEGADKDARLQYLSWRIWFMKRRQAMVQQARRAAEAHEEDSVGGGTEVTSEYNTDDDEELTTPRTPVSAAPLAAAAVAELMSSGKGMTDLVRAASGAAAVTDVFPTRSQPAALPPAAASAVAGGGGEGSVGALGLPKPKKSLQISTRPRQELDRRIDTVFEDLASPLPPAETPRPLDTRYERLYIILVSLHGLVRGEAMELGRDSDTGGQVKYVVELTKALALHPAVYRVELLTRLIRDPKVDADYGQEEECLRRGSGEHGGAYIVRLPCGPVDQYIRKELLWPHVREFADRGIAHARRMLGAMAEAGRRCELYAVHGHYADAGEVCVMMSCTLGVPMVMTGHSLGRNKLEHLLASGAMTRQEVEETYKISDRIEAEERCLDHAVTVFTSTQQEIDEQWGLYDGYSPHLARVLRFRLSYGRHMPFMKVSPPGLDFSNLKVNIPEDPVVKEFEQQRALLGGLDLVSGTPRGAGGEGSGGASLMGSPAKQGDEDRQRSPSPRRVGGTPTSGSPTLGEGVAGEAPASPRQLQGGMPSGLGAIPHGPRLWQDIARFLRNPLKPAVLAMSRADPKKNITTLVQAFAEHPMLRELANLVLIMGNRDNIDSMAGGSQKVLVQVLKLIDAYDLYGSVAYPKHHTQPEISDIYNFAAATRGVFVNPALQEPFGLTVIEAAAHGVPTVATRNGGPVDIMNTLHHGVVVDPTNSQAIAEALLKILTDPQVWDRMSASGVQNIMAYSWPSHCKRYLDSLDAELKFIKSSRKHDRTMSGLLEKRVLQMPEAGEGEAGPGAAGPGGASAAAPSDAPSIMDRVMSLPAPLPKSTMGGEAPSGGAPRTMASGLSTDDLAVLHSLTPEELARTAEQPTCAFRTHWVVVPLDGDHCVGSVAGTIRTLQEAVAAAGQGDQVGVGVLSMMGFDSTKQLLQAAGVDAEGVDFMVCNSGADMWVQLGEGHWDSDEQYEALIDWQWDRISLHRMLQKIVSQPAAENSARMLPRLKELLYDVGRDPEAGVHPRHFCVELDPETQAILAVGMGPRRGSRGPALMRSVVERLKRRLRARGFRANYNLQLVPQPQGEVMGVLQITPLRASRSLALRFLADRLGMDLGRVAVVAVVPEVQKGRKGALVAGAYTGDTVELVEGMHKVLVLPSSQDSPPSPHGSTPLPPGTLSQALGVSLDPWVSGGRQGDRVVVVGESEGGADALAEHLLRWVEESGSREEGGDVGREFVGERVPTLEGGLAEV